MDEEEAEDNGADEEEAVMRRVCDDGKGKDEAYLPERNSHPSKFVARSSFCGAWLVVDTLPYDFFVLCVLCAPKFGEFFLRYNANWKLITVHQ